MPISNSLNITQSSISGGQQTAQNTQKTGLFKSQPTQSQNLEQTAIKNGLEGLDKLVGRVLDELKNSSGASKLEQLAQQAKQTQIAPNLANELKDLVKSLEAEPNLKELATKLKQFLKPIDDLSAAPLNEQVKNSGIMLEANLRQALSGEKLPSSIQKLLSDIKNLSDPKLFSQILDLASDATLDNAGSFSKLNSILNEAKSAAWLKLDASNFKTLFSDVDKLDAMAKFIDKSLLKTLNPDNIKAQVGKMEDFALRLSDKISQISNEKLALSSGFSSNYKELKSVLEKILSQLNSLNSIGDEAGLLKAYQSAVGGEATLQDKLQSAARRLAQSLNFADSSASAAKTNLDETKALLKQLNRAMGDVSNIEPKSEADIAKSLNSDVKSVLLSVQEKAQNQNLAQAAGKMLSQIEMHQMVSALQGGLQTYMPYVWDGTQGGSVSFKRGKKDKYYAQIDLKFKEYGQVNVMVGLIDKRYIDLSVATQTSEFKELIAQNAASLKQAIGELGLIVSNFNLKILPKTHLGQKFKNFGGLELGFDKKI